MSKNDIHWAKIFEEHRILQNIDSQGFHKISATEINVYREARLMTKFDHQIQLPKIFKDNNLTIQPDSRGTYILGRFASYQALPEIASTPEIISFPTDIETLNPQNLFSEAMSLLCAHNAGIIDNLIGEESRLTVMGRMSTGKFTYAINNAQNGERHTISVENSQCEIDSGFESANQFAIIEAKSEGVSDFLIRQLYYPYRLWKPKTQKTVVPIFLSISDSIFNFYVFYFNEESHYNSIEPITQKSFQIGSIEIELEDIVSILNETVILPEPENVPFPQADSFSRIVDLITRIYSEQNLSKENITANYDFDIRQTDYYISSGKYLGLLGNQRTHDGVRYHLTAVGLSLMEQSFRIKHLSLVKAVLQHEVFHKTLRLYFDQAFLPRLDQVVEIMKDAGLAGVGSESTRRRRAQTVLSWIDWIMQLTKR